MRLRGISAAADALGPLVVFGALAAAIFVAAIFVAGCGDKTPKYPSCGSDKDCRSGEHCVNKQCRQCAGDNHCQKGETCIDGGCVLGPGACRRDADCPNGEPCLQNLCRACRDDDQCGATRRCRDGRCLARGKCTRDEDCADDEDCKNGTCRGPGRGMSPDVACKLTAIYFGFDEAGLNDVARGQLNDVAECVQSAPGRGVFLNGYTDPRGTEEYNIALSERRAQTVAEYLARLGIDPARFRIVAQGETSADGTDETSWSRDRRVEIEWQ